MRKSWIPCAVMLAFLLIFVPQAMADGFYCGSRIVSLGDRQSEVLEKCGSPASVSVREEIRTRKDYISGLLDPDTGLPLLISELVAIEEWEYNFGPDRFIRYLEFEKGSLVRITDGDYGH